MKKLIVLVSILLVGLVSLKAQVSSHATITVAIITPISITKIIDMNFGNISVNATLGTVILAPNGSRIATGGVTLPVTNGTVSAAGFTITGLEASSYSISLPTTYTITKQSGTETMIVNTFTSTPSSTGTLFGGTGTLNIGATLNVSASQVSGIYTNTLGFPVTVNYN